VLLLELKPSFPRSLPQIVERHHVWIGLSLAGDAASNVASG
jgi:hypothetical protein